MRGRWRQGLWVCMLTTEKPASVFMARVQVLSGRSWLLKPPTGL